MGLILAAERRLYFKEWDMVEYFKHATDSAEDEGLSTLMDSFGSDGYAVYFLSLERMCHFERPLTPIGAKMVAKTLGLDAARVLDILRFACSEECGKLLEKAQGEGYWSEVAEAEVAQRKALSEKRREAINSRWRKKLDTSVIQA